MPYKDPEKQKAYDKARYEKNKDREKERRKAWYEKNKDHKRACTKAWSEKNKDIKKALNKARYEANRKYINKIKGNPCSRCGGIFTPSAMEFHHIDPETKANKDNKSGSAINPSWSRKKIDEEIAKCILVCANCHRTIHASVEEVLEFEIWQTTETQRDSSGIRRI